MTECGARGFPLFILFPALTAPIRCELKFNLIGSRSFVMRLRAKRIDISIGDGLVCVVSMHLHMFVLFIIHPMKKLKIQSEEMRKWYPPPVG